MDRGTAAAVKRALRGPGAILAATSVAGVLGIVLTTVTARVLGAELSAGFSAFWSAIYFAVGALAGVQQEVARASRADGTGHTPPLTRFVLISAAVVGGVIALSSIGWLTPVFGPHPELVGPLVVGAAGYVCVAVIGGSLYGLHRWPLIAGLVVVDAVLRIVAVFAVLAVTLDLAALAWAVALPFGAALIPFLLFSRTIQTLGRSTTWDARAPRIAAQAAATVLGALATSAIISGFAAFLVASSPDVDRATLGAVAFGVTLIRAPLVVTVLSLQGYMIVRFRDAGAMLRPLLTIVGLVACATAVLAGAAVLTGDAVLGAVVGPDFRLGSVTLVTIVASSGLLALMCVVGALLVARGRQPAYALCWGVTVIATVVGLWVPAELDVRLALALLAAPAAGFVAQALALIVFRPRLP
jgi:O-antigen/teichoic acid export membrane protein